MTPSEKNRLTAHLRIIVGTMFILSGKDMISNDLKPEHSKLINAADKFDQLANYYLKKMMQPSVKLLADNHYSAINEVFGYLLDTEDEIEYIRRVELYRLITEGQYKIEGD